MDVTLPRILTPREWFVECREMCARKMSELTLETAIDVEIELDPEVVEAASGSAGLVEHVARKMPISRKDVEAASRSARSRSHSGSVRTVARLM